MNENNYVIPSKPMPPLYPVSLKKVTKIKSYNKKLWKNIVSKINVLGIYV